MQKECRVEEGHLMPDHVHMMISIPPKYAVSQVIGYIKGKSAIRSYATNTRRGSRLINLRKDPSAPETNSSLALTSFTGTMASQRLKPSQQSRAETDLSWRPASPAKLFDRCDQALSDHNSF
jgi:REP element-mobilizing transposase RayT